MLEGYCPHILCRIVAWDKEDEQEIVFDKCSLCSISALRLKISTGREGNIILFTYKRR